MDAETRRAISKLAQELTRTQAELARVKRGSRRPQLGHSSIDSGALEVRDPDTGVTRLRLGYQPDGSVGVVPEGGDPPSAPSTPIVAGAPVGVMVQWDGRLAHDQTLPADFDHVSVHVSQVQGFVPDAATFQGTIPRSGGLFPVVPLEVGTTYYVRLVGVGTGGAEGAPSEEAPGVPEAVGGVPPPGSITETEIADDAVTAPKIRAEAVEAYHIVAQAIEAGHIEAGAVEAAHLAATIVLASRLVAGDPSAARVEIDESGLRGYNDGDELVFAVQDGDAVFSGDITGSHITGSSISIGASPGAVGSIEEEPGAVRARVTSAGGHRAQLSASTNQAEFTVWAQPGVAAPVGGMVAQSDIVALTMQSASGDASQPYAQHAVTPGRAIGLWRAASGSGVQVQATVGNAQMLLTSPDASDPDDAQGSGYLFGVRYASDIAALSMQGPVWGSGDGPERSRRATMHIEGARPDRPYTRVVYSARRHLIQGESDGSGYDSVSDGVVSLASTHSISAPRHRAVRTDLNSSPTALSTGDFVDFTESQMPSLEFETGWSGRVRVIIQMCGINYRTNASTIALGFRLAGAGTVPASLQRAAMTRSVGSGGPATSGRPAFQIVDLDLIGNSTYTLTPMWRISGSGHSWGDMHSFDMNYQNSIIVEPLM